VLRRLANSDHVTLLLARRLQARGPQTEGFQILDIHDDEDDDGSNRGHISDVSASQAEPQSQKAAEVVQTTTTEGQQQEGITEAVTEETEGQDEDIQAAIAESLGTAASLPTRSRDDDDDDSHPEHPFKCTVPGCGRKFSEHHELKGMSLYLAAGYLHSDSIP
jgi:hypothetical protein